MGLEMRVPSNYFITIKKPHLFSFQKPIVLGSTLRSKINQFETIRYVLNSIASNTRVPAQEILRSENVLFDFLLFLPENGLPRSRQQEEHFIRVNLALYVLYNNTSGLPGQNLKNICLDRAINGVKALTEKSEEMWWYYACLLRYQANAEDDFDIFLVQETILCIENIQSRRHKETLAYFIHQEYYLKLSEYPNYELLSKVEQLLLGLPYKLDGHCVWLRHQFVLAFIKNKDYFNVQSSSLLNKTTIPVPLDLQFKFSQEKNSILLEKINDKIRVDQYSLFKFCAHLVSPTPPILYIKNEELTNSNTTEEFNIILKKRHRTERFCNGEGFLDIERIKKDFIRFRTITFEELVIFLKHKNIYLFLNALQEQEYREKFDNEFTLDKIKPELERLDRQRESLAGFNGIEALFLFYKSLLPHAYGLEQKLLTDIQEVIRGCLEITYQTERANKLSQGAKHKQWFSIAENIVSSLIASPRNLLIQVGTPIKEGEKHSTHAFYVSIKYLKTSNQFQLIITNGGSAVNRFHQISPNQHPKDREEYCYAAFSPFDINTCFKELTNYLYLLISLEYRGSIKEDLENETNPDSYLNLLKSVYLREKSNEAGTIESFRGFQYKEFYTFKREDLTETFLSQVTGNCTIHNLKKSLQILFAMDQLIFGLLEDNLALGFDQLISHYIEQTKNPSAVLTQSPPVQSSAFFSVEGKKLMRNSSIDFLPAIFTELSEDLEERRPRAQTK